MIDTERVILEVQARPVLWDMRNELYKDRDARQKAWLEVCGEIIENFADLRDKEKKNEEKKIQARWKSARDCYQKLKASNKKLKSGSCAKKTKSYAYYNMMTFLECNSRNESQESLGEDENASNISVLSDSYIQGTEIATPGTSSQDAEIPIPGTSSQDAEIPIPGPSSQDGNIRTSGTSKRPRKSNSPTPFEKELLKSVQRRNEENDENMAFFTSIMHTIKKFDTYQKLVFRTKIMEYLIEIEKQKVLEIDNLTFTTDLFPNTSQT